MLTICHFGNLDSQRGSTKTRPLDFKETIYFKLFELCWRFFEIKECFGVKNFNKKNRHLSGVFFWFYFVNFGH